MNCQRYGKSVQPLAKIPPLVFQFGQRSITLGRQGYLVPTQNQRNTRVQKSQNLEMMMAEMKIVVRDYKHIE